jgi:superfamily II DNA/RNA helicase
MTATCSSRIQHVIQQLTGIPYIYPNWPVPAQMRHRRVRIIVAYTDRSFAALKKDVVPRLLSYPPQAKFIVYSNSCSKIEKVEIKLADCLDSNDDFSKIDIVCLVGTLTKEQKAHYIDVFVNGSPGFNPRFLVATSGAVNAGIDCDEVFGVYRLDFPSSLIDLCQEKGRAAYSPRRLTSFFIICSIPWKAIFIFSSEFETRTNRPSTPPIGRHSWKTYSRYTRF